MRPAAPSAHPHCRPRRPLDDVVISAVSEVAVRRSFCPAIESERCSRKPPPAIEASGERTSERTPTTRQRVATAAPLHPLPDQRSGHRLGARLRDRHPGWFRDMLDSPCTVGLDRSGRSPRHRTELVPQNQKCNHRFISPSLE